MEFNALMDKWSKMLTGGPAPSSREAASPFRDSAIIRLADRARRNQAGMMVGLDCDSLWADLPVNKDARHVSQTYLRLKEMAIAHETEGSELYRKAGLARAIRQGLEWAYDSIYNEYTPVYGNWWHWEIGAPLALLDTLILMRRQLPAGLVASCLRAVDRCTPNPQWQLATVKPDPHPTTGANRVWKTRVCFFSALLKRDGAAMAACCGALNPVFEYVEDGDGFYEDGSFIQHRRFAYTGGYGRSLLKELSELLELLSGSVWEIPARRISHVFRWMEEAYEPLMYRGIMMDMARGREVSRQTLQDCHAGHAVLGGVLRLIGIAPPKKAARLKRTAKHWIMAGMPNDYLEAAPLDLADAAWRLLHDPSVEPRGDYRISKVFARMDRAVHQRPGFAVGISMFSNRIVAYESINGDNLHGWHTAHGMTYLYNNDLGQYSDGFWPTVNPYRMPGTTAGTRPRSKGEGSYMTSSKPFAGGAVLQELCSAVGMELEEPGEFQARKSWFLFGDQVIALGSGIRTEKPLRLETTVDNRMLSREGGDTVTFGEAGQSCLLAADGITETRDARWIHLEGRLPGTDVGYVFPRRQPVSLLREARTGSWGDIQEYGSPEEVTRRYLTIWFDHGLEPSAGEYAYVLLPGRTAAQTAAYREQGEAEIIELSTEAHGARITRLGLTGIIFWEDKVKKAGPVTCSGRAAVVLKEEEASLAVAVADPTMEHDGLIEVELDACAGGIAAREERITVIRLEPSIRFTVDVSGAKGRSFSVVFAK